MAVCSASIDETAPPWMFPRFPARSRGNERCLACCRRESWRSGRWRRARQPHEWLFVVPEKCTPHVVQQLYVTCCVMKRNDMQYARQTGVLQAYLTFCNMCIWGIWPSYRTWTELHFSQHVSIMVIQLHTKFDVDWWNTLEMPGVGRICPTMLYTW